MRVFFTNLGCKLNQAEVDAMARRFLAAGHRVVPALDEADLHVVNSCTVTHQAARDSRRVARKAGRLADRARRTVVTGCYVAASPQEAAGLAGVDLVVPNDEKEWLLERVEERFPDLRTPAVEPPEVPVSYVPLEFGPTRGLVKIEDGCNMSCSFCIIPSTRGRQRSRDPAEIVTEVQALEAGGYKEVVVTGVQISSYRAAGLGLVDLVERLLAATSTVRLRLTSIAPWQFDPRLYRLLRHDRICRHVHLSLQSGCDATLERMRRPYSGAAYAALLAELRRQVPQLAVTTDVIVGFPGEDDAEFETSLRFVAACRFAKIHAFSYSSRPGTLAATMPDPVPPPVIKERVRRMIEVGERSARRFVAALAGSRLEVLWEEERDGIWRGMSDNYVRVAGTDDALRRGALRHAMVQRSPHSPHELAVA